MRIKLKIDYMHYMLDMYTIVDGGSPSRMRIIGASRQRFRKISGVRLYLELVERQIPKLRCLVSEYW